MDLYSKFRHTHPHAFFLDGDDPESLENYLINQGWFDPDISLMSVEETGGNTMNKVLRITLSNGQSFIIKQSRPWVEALPDIPAPTERANVEGAFLQEIARNKTTASYSPEVLQTDPDAHILLMEDLGAGSELTYLYKQDKEMDEEKFSDLLEYLSALHQNFTQQTCDFYIVNPGMRKLNAEHIFRFPFVEDNGLDLNEITPGFAEVAKEYRSDEELMDQISFLQYRYVQNGETLLHGDFCLTSILDTDDGIKVIDPEFCFFGDAEFDLGVLHAHLLMAQQPENITGNIFEYYEQPPTFSKMLYQQYTGMEILRRLLGLEQLPLALNLEEKKALLEKAYAMLLEE